MKEVVVYGSLLEGIEKSEIPFIVAVLSYVALILSFPSVIGGAISSGLHLMTIGIGGYVNKALRSRKAAMTSIYMGTMGCLLSIYMGIMGCLLSLVSIFVAVS